nr:MAG TPA: hypothetical protein [Caudoviricetes sp.]
MLRIAATFWTCGRLFLFALKQSNAINQRATR